MSRKKRGKKSGKPDFLKVHEREVIEEAPNPNWQKVKVSQIYLEPEWIEKLIRRNVAAILKIDIPEDAVLYMDYQYPILKWSSDPTPCNRPTDEDDDDDEDICPVCDEDPCKCDDEDDDDDED